MTSAMPACLVPILLLHLTSLTAGLEWLQQPGDAVAVAGRPFWWHCRASDSAPVSYRWRFGEADMPVRAGQRVHSNGSLELASPGAQDLGQYQCVASTSSLSLYSQPATLQLAYLADTVALSSPSSLPVARDSVLSLACVADSLPPADVTWWLNGTPVTRGTSSVTSSGVVLMVRDVSYRDQGNYTCRAHNGLLNASRSSNVLSVRVHGRPEVTESPSPLSLALGMDATFRCLATGDPAPTLVWQRQVNGSTVTLQTGGRVSVGEGRLVIASVTEQDAGLYTCLAFSAQGQDSAVAMLSVSGSPEAPRVTSLSGDVTVPFNTSVELQCQASGNPAPNITWSKVGGTLPGGSVERSPGTLVLVGVGEGDGGLYRCMAASSLGSHSRDLLLTVQVPPRLQLRPDNTEVEAGQEVTLPCSASASPPASIAWTLPSGDVVASPGSSGGVQVLASGALYMAAISPLLQGLYVCTATNSLGSATASAQISVRSTPVLVETPVSQGALQGDSVQFLCRALGHPDPTVTWYKDAEASPLVAGVGVELLTSGGLRLTSVTPSQAGRYHCVASNQFGNVSASASLSVLVPPSFSLLPQDVRAGRGGQARLECQTQGVPVPTQRWLRHNASLVLDNSVLLLPNYTLVFLNLSRDQFGDYVCAARNQAGSTVASARLLYTDIPYLASPPVNVTANLSGQAMLQCGMQAEGHVTVTWYAAGDQASVVAAEGSDDVSTPDVTLAANGSLLFSGVRLEQEGWYYCQGSTVEGSTASDPAFLDVLYAAEVTQVTASGGQPSRLSCVARGDPAPQLSWTSPSGLEMGGQGGELVLPQPSVLQHAGNWSCRACNSLGCDQASVLLQVEGAPVIRTVQALQSAAVVTIACVTVGLPAADVTFLATEGRDVRGMPGHDVSGSTMTVTSSSLLASYECRASNQFGNASLSLTVPGTPTQPRVTAVGAREVTVTWSLTSTGGLPLTWLLLYKEGDQAQTREVNVTLTSGPSPQLQTRLSGLTPHSPYSLAVQARNVLGTGPPSIPSPSFSTLSAAPSPPGNVTANVTGRVLLLSWQPPLALNGDPGDVVIQVLVEGASLPQPRVVRRSVGEPPLLEVSGLPPGSYSLTLTSSNLALQLSSPSVLLHVLLPLPAPDFVPSILAVTSLAWHHVLVAWTAAGPGLAPPVEGYMVTYGIQGLQGSEVRVRVEGRESNSTSITGLQERSVYVISLAAFNQAGLGPFSPLANVTTPYNYFTRAAYLGPGWQGLVLGVSVAVAAGLLLLLFILLLLLQSCRRRRQDSLSLLRPSHHQPRYLERSNPDLHRNADFDLY